MPLARHTMLVLQRQFPGQFPDEAIRGCDTRLPSSIFETTITDLKAWVAASREVEFTIFPIPQTKRCSLHRIPPHWTPRPHNHSIFLSTQQIPMGDEASGLPGTEPSLHAYLPTLLPTLPQKGLADFQGTPKSTVVNLVATHIVPMQPEPSSSRPLGCSLPFLKRQMCTTMPIEL